MAGIEGVRKRKIQFVLCQQMPWREMQKTVPSIFNAGVSESNAAPSVKAQLETRKKKRMRANGEDADQASVKRKRDD